MIFAMGGTNNKPTRVFCSVRMASGFPYSSGAPMGTALDVGVNLDERFVAW